MKELAKITSNWKHFKRKGMILPPHNKDEAIFEEKINGKFYVLHGLSRKNIGGNHYCITVF